MINNQIFSVKTLFLKEQDWFVAVYLFIGNLDIFPLISLNLSDIFSINQLTDTENYQSV